MNRDAHHRYEWNTMPWRKLEVKVFKLQRRIYQATTRGETKKAHRLQRLLATSWSAKSLAVRKVTTLALSFDHRIVDGDLGSAVLRDIGAMLEDPLRMLAWS